MLSTPLALKSKKLPTEKKIPSANRKNLKVAIVEGIWSTLLLNMLAGPFLTAYLLYLGATSTQIGIVLAIPSIANLLQVLSAIMMQRVKNRKNTFFIFAVSLRLIGLFLGLIPFLFPKSLWLAVFISMFLLYSILNAFTAVLWTSLISDMVPTQVRGKYFGIRNVIASAANSIGLFVTGMIIDRFPGGMGFNIMFILATITIAVNIYYLYQYPNPVFEKAENVKNGALVLKPFKDRNFLKGMMFLAAWTLIFAMTHPFFSYVMLDILQVKYQIVSNLVILQAAFSMLGYYVCGKLSYKYSDRTLLLGSLPFLAAASLAWGGLLFLPQLLVLILVFILLGFGLGSYGQQIFIFMIGNSSKAERPIYIAVFSAITGIAGFTGPVIGGVVFDYLVKAPLWVQQYGYFVLLGFILLILGIIIAPFSFSKSKLK